MQQRTMSYTRKKLDSLQCHKQKYLTERMISKMLTLAVLLRASQLLPKPEFLQAWDQLK